MPGRGGSSIVECASGEEGLAASYAAHCSGVPLALAITDLTMPGGMNGGELVCRLREIGQGGPTVVSSGHSSEPVLSELQALGVSSVLEKPYTYQALSAIGRRAVARPAPEQACAPS